MRKTVIIKEGQTKNLMSTNDWPEYFHPAVNGGIVRLYHGLTMDSLDYVLTNEEFTPKTCAEGVNGLWFSTEGSGDYPSGYQCMVSIDVPESDISRYYDHPFKIMNSTHVLAEKSIPLFKYPFKVLKIKGATLDDEMRTHWNNLLEEKGAEFNKWLEGFCESSSVYYHIMDWILGETNN